MSDFKFREPITDRWGMFSEFHYWGVIDGKYIPPDNGYELSAGWSGQFTGLQDNKRTEEFPEGQEVYENDRFEMCGSGNAYTVIKKYGAFGYLTRGGDFVTLYHLIQNHMAFEIIGNDWEIIGNIHEDPELQP